MNRDTIVIPRALAGFSPKYARIDKGVDENIIDRVRDG
jgi:hypothetical protein